MEKVKKPFVPYDNLKNENPKLCEFPIFNEGFKLAQKEQLDYWGFLSPKFSEKSGLTEQKFYDWITPGSTNVYIVNPCPLNECLFPSVIVQGNNCHPGLTDLIQRVMNRMNIPINVDQILMDSTSFALCNYFVGDNIFWPVYLKFVNNFINEVKNNPNDSKLMFDTGAHYGPNGSLPYYTFVIERLLSIFLNISSGIKYQIYQYSKEELLNKTKLPEEIMDEIRALSAIKLAAISGKHFELLEHWILLRNNFAKRYPNIFNLE
jgi:hypothetical protein